MQLHTYTGEQMRRSLTVTPENDKKILLTKGRFLSGDEPYDIDYTTMVNILIELGHKLMWQAWNDTTTNTTVTMNKADIVESFKKHFFNAELKEEAVGDQVAEIIFKKLVEQTHLAIAPSHQIVKKGPTQAIDDEDEEDKVAAAIDPNAPTDPKMKKYVS
ncbi:MAG: hypothetical protein M1490_05840 [Candidatus Bathyarchaeota archaeon]|nr:hypothetical protein [Candidatus Bathyarchaeota archaeon]